MPIIIDYYAESLETIIPPDLAMSRSPIYVSKFPFRPGIVSIARLLPIHLIGYMPTATICDPNSKSKLSVTCRNRIRPKSSGATRRDEPWRV
jgi:hypothetical protein